MRSGRQALLFACVLSYASAFCGEHFILNALTKARSGSRMLALTMRDEDVEKTLISRPDWKQRREVLGAAIRLGACGCAACVSMASPRLAGALAQLVKPAEEAVKKFDVPRDQFLDAAFACGMATGMADYEEAASA